MTDPLPAPASAAANSRHRSSAIPLAAAYTGLLVYASLYPFIDWRWPGALGWLELFRLPFPPWRDHFDMWANLLGYMPLGGLLCLAVMRSGGRARWAWLLAVLGGSALSYAMEVTQQFLPRRYPSGLDWALNSAGALAGASLAAPLQALRLIDRWQATRDRWFWRRSGSALALLLLWPLGLLFPAPFPLGMGLGWERVQDELVGWLLDVTWAQQVLEMVSDIPAPTERLPLVVEGLGMVLGLLGPCLLAYSITRTGWRRAVMALGALTLGLAATTLSAALNFGPGHAAAWLAPGVVPALLIGLLLALALLMVPQRLAAALGMAALLLLVTVVAQAPADPYFSLSLQAWEQGRFIRFHGLAQWIGWLWPYAAILWLAGRVASAEHMRPMEQSKPASTRRQARERASR
ncbi:VanZ family protein [Ideonella azotifigens]|uniref:VanZ family protein n=2 Tax=Ideonella azotifigens TaxID=513160 RepID=A0ABP3VUV2_9BURK|nr:VanZ family protein [Ideonella azotifigens]MCD2344805.1 VanZ family protein [Ideonella azotifigens]